jgi:8-oxo-dGTP diphosphatase
LRNVRTFVTMPFMKHRIRAAAVIVKDNAILLVKHKHPVKGVEWWVPPGGGLLEKESVYECAVRETWEEAGIKVVLGNILYLSEFIDLEQDYHHFEVFILADSFSGTPNIQNLIQEDMDANYVKEARFLTRKEMAGLTVFPKILKDGFWDDLAAGKLQTKYLGQSTG